MRQHRRMSSPPLRPTVIQIRRLRQLWRSAGWPCQDMLEVELLALGWLGFLVSVPVGIGFALGGVVGEMPGARQRIPR